MRIRFVRPLCWGLAPFLVLAPRSVGQGQGEHQDPSAVTEVHAPLEAEAVPGAVEPEVTAGERVPAAAIEIIGLEDWDVVHERQANAPMDGAVRGERNGAAGAWVVPSLNAAGQAHSGVKYVLNKWGDTSMGISFGAPVDVQGAWFAGQGGDGSWAPAVRIVGYRAGAVVATSEWLEPLGAAPVPLRANLSGIDRIVVEARPTSTGAGFWALDDLAFTPVGGEQRVLDFEDLDWRTELTGSNYAGLAWERGTGSFSPPDAESSAPIDAPAGPPQMGPIARGLPSNPAGGTATAPMLRSQFNGPVMFDTGANSIPPDTCGAVGIDHFVSVTNFNLSVYEKATGTRVISTSMGSFFGVTAGDPRVVFDTDSQRFIILATTFSSTARIYFAVSASADPTGPWFKFNFNTAQGSDVGRWPDHPTLGVDQRGIYTAAFMVGGTAQMTLWALDKGPLIAASQSVGTLTAFRDLAYEGAIQPAVHHEDAGRAYCVSVSGFNMIRIRSVNPPLTVPTLSNLALVNVGFHSNPPNAAALGSTTPLNTVDDRLVNAVYRGGGIYATHCVGVNNRAAVRWYELDPNGALVQSGTIEDPVRHYFFPSISVNADEDVLIGFSASSPTMFAGAWVAGRAAGDAPGQTSTPFEFRAGLGAYNRLDSAGRNRWGDYSLTSADPVDGTLWTIQEHAQTGNRWSCAVAEFDFGPPPIEKYCVLSPNSAGPGSVIEALGSVSMAANDLSMFAFGNPVNQFGMFFYGDAQTQVPAGNGNLCVSGNIFRFSPQVTDVLGTATATFDNQAPPGGGPAFAVGETWNFQFWLRDPAGGGANFNFSDGVAITFVP